MKHRIQNKRTLYMIVLSSIVIVGIVALVFIYGAFFSTVKYDLGESKAEREITGAFPNETARVVVRMRTFINGKPIGGYVAYGQEGYYYRLHTNPNWNTLIETYTQVNVSIYGEGVRNITIERGIYFEIIGIDFDDDGVADLVLLENTTISYPFPIYTATATTPVNFSDSFTMLAKTNTTDRDNLGTWRSRRNHPLIVHYYTVIRVSITFYFSGTTVQSDWIRVNSTNWSEAYAKEYVEVDVQASITPFLIGGAVIALFIGTIVISLRMMNAEKALLTRKKNRW